jgi:type IV secretion system protein VirB6
MAFYNSVTQSVTDPLASIGNTGIGIYHWFNSPHVNSQPYAGFHVFQTISTSFNQITNGFVLKETQGLLNVLTGVISTLVLCYIIWQGIKILYGMKGQRPFSELGVLFTKMAVISYFALNAQNYANDVGNLINAINQSLTEGIMGHHGTIAQSMDRMLNHAFVQLNFAQNQIRVMQGGTWSWIIVVLAIIIGYLAFTIESAILVLGSQVMIVLLTSVGSLFLCCLMFEPTKRFFDSWVSKLVEQIFTIMLAMLVSNFMTQIFYKIVVSNSFIHVVNPFAVALKVLIVGAVSYWALQKCNQLAGSLAGGFALGVMQFGDLSEGAKQAYNLTSPITKGATIPMSYAMGYAADKATGGIKKWWDGRGDNISGAEAPKSGAISDVMNDPNLKQVKAAIAKHNNHNNEADN